MSDNIPTEDTNRLQITFIPPLTQRGSTPTEQQVTKLGEKSISPTNQQGREEELEEDIESDDPEYTMTKENLRKIAKEVATSKKRKALQEQGKGKCKIIHSESEDEE